MVRTISVEVKGKKLDCKGWVNWRRGNWDSVWTWFLWDGCLKGEGGPVAESRWECQGRFLTVQVIWLCWNAYEKESIESKRRESPRWWVKETGGFLLPQEGRKEMATDAGQSLCTCRKLRKFPTAWRPLPLFLFLSIFLLNCCELVVRLLC